MSPANVEYVLRHNPSITAERVEVCPNSIELHGKKSGYNNGVLLQKLNIPTDKLLLIYGGNLGRPQGIDFLMNVLAANEKRTDTYFVVVGNGTEYGKISQWFRNNTPHNSCLIPSLPKQEYDDLVSACDVGLNFPGQSFHNSQLSFQVTILFRKQNARADGYGYEYGYWSNSRKEWIMVYGRKVEIWKLLWRWLSLLPRTEKS